MKSQIKTVTVQSIIQNDIVEYKNIETILREDTRLGSLIDVLVRIITQGMSFSVPINDDYKDVLDFCNDLKKETNFELITRDLLVHGFYVIDRFSQLDYDLPIGYDRIDILNADNLISKDSYKKIESYEYLDVMKLHDSVGMDFIKYTKIPTFFFDKSTLSKQEFDDFSNFIRIIRNSIRNLILEILFSYFDERSYAVAVNFSDLETESILDKIYIKGMHGDKVVGYGTLHNKEFGMIKLDNIIYDPELKQICVNGQWEIPFED